jgi:hypothetical protein
MMNEVFEFLENNPNIRIIIRYDTKQRWIVIEMENEKSTFRLQHPILSRASVNDKFPPAYFTRILETMKRKIP